MFGLACLRNALLALAVIGCAAPPVEAMDIFDGAREAAQIGDGAVMQVRNVRAGGGHRAGGAHHRPVHRPGGPHRPPAHRPPAHRPGHRPPANRPNVRPPVHRPGYRPGYRPPAARPPVARPPAVRRPVVVVPPRGVWVGRPGWYGWSPGGAIAAGAALGFVTAAAAGAFAGPPPQPGLCWYYTDPSRRQGFWDACP